MGLIQGVGFQERDDLPDDAQQVLVLLAKVHGAHGMISSDDDPWILPHRGTGFASLSREWTG
jgi:hypothetical protein